jgi:hypothetical protein
MAEPGYDPIPVNSNKIPQNMKPFTQNFIQTQKRCIGAIIINNNQLRDELENLTATGGLAGRDLKANGFIGSCVLIDYNYIFLCAHTIDSLFTSIGASKMKDKKIIVVFNNEYTKGTVDSSSPVAESNRPFAYIRGDIEALDGGTHEDDAGLLKIEWPTSDEYVKVNFMARLAHPKNFNASSLINTRVCCIEQYSEVSRAGKFNSRKECIYSTNASQGKVSLKDVAIRTTESPTGKAPHYCKGAFSGTFGGSGSGVFNLDNELVGNFVAAESFLPIDRAYNNPKIGQKLKDIYTYRAAREGWPPI